MREPLRNALLGLALFFPAVAVAALQSDQTATGIVLGRVIDAQTKQAIAGVRVTRWRINPADATQFETVTDQQGRFLFRNVSAGDWRILAETIGYSSGSPGRRRPNGPDRLVHVVGDIQNVSIELTKADGTLVGSVTDESGEPVVAVTVRALRRASTWPSGRAAFSPWPGVALTDDRGRFRLRVPVGDYTMFVSPALVSTSAPDQTLAASDSSAIVAETIDGQRLLVGQTNRPAPLPPMLGTRGLDRVYEIAFSPPEYSENQSATVHVGPGTDSETPPIHLHFANAVRVSGRLTGPGGLRGFTVRLLPSAVSMLTADARLEITSTVSDSQGGFVLMGVPPGRYLLRADKATPSVRVLPSSIATDPAAISTASPAPVPIVNALTTEMEVNVGSGDVAGLDVPLRRSASVRGRFAFVGIGSMPTEVAVARLGVSLQALDKQPMTLPVPRAEATGAFTTAEYPPGRYVLFVLPPSGFTLISAMYRNQDLTTRSFELNEEVIDGVIVTFSNVSASVSGVVRTTLRIGDGNATVVAFPADFKSEGAVLAPTHRTAEVRVAQDGTYALKGLPTGEYYVVAIDDADAGNWRSLDMLATLAPLASKTLLKVGENVVLDLQTRRVGR